jgi:hypothetical protein
MIVIRVRRLFLFHVCRLTDVIFVAVARKRSKYFCVNKRLSSAYTVIQVK